MVTNAKEDMATNRLMMWWCERSKKKRLIQNLVTYSVLGYGVRFLKSTFTRRFFFINDVTQKQLLIDRNTY